MFRALFITLSKASRAQRLITQWPLAWQAASRFIAGDTPADAIRAVRELNDKGINASLDHLGENTTTAEEAAQATADILLILDEIARAGVRANVSIKLSQIGLALAGREALCRENLVRILRCAEEHNTFVRIDMEDSSYTERTLALFRAMRQSGFGEQRVGVVVQSYLYRSGYDVTGLVEQHARIRLTKGAYREPPSVAYQRKADVDRNYDRLAELLIGNALAAGAPQLSGDGRVPPISAFATHDERRIEFARAYAQRLGLPNAALEFQMLYGIRRDLQQQLAAQGYPVRVYVPYGTHWYPYFMRRLAERPENVWFFGRNALRR
jgi:proline dehydrogenase